MEPQAPLISTLTATICSLSDHSQPPPIISGKGNDLIGLELVLETVPQVHLAGGTEDIEIASDWIICTLPKRLADIDWSLEV